MSVQFIFLSRASLQFHVYRSCVSLLLPSVCLSHLCHAFCSSVCIISSISYAEWYWRIKARLFAAEGDARTDWEPLTVSCEGFVQLTEAVPDKGDDHSGDNRGGGDDDDPAADAGRKFHSVFAVMLSRWEAEGMLSFPDRTFGAGVYQLRRHLEQNNVCFQKFSQVVACSQTLWGKKKKDREKKIRLTCWIAFCMYGGNQWTQNNRGRGRGKVVMNWKFHLWHGQWWSVRKKNAKAEIIFIVRWWWWLFSRLWRFFWECSTIYSPPALFCCCLFEVEISSCTLIPLCMP